MRLPPEQRRAIILKAAVRVASSDGLVNVSHGSVSKRCSVPTSAATVKHYFPTQTGLWKAVVAEDDSLSSQAEEFDL